MDRGNRILIIVVVIFAVVAMGGSRLYVIVPPGYTAVAHLLGEVQPEPYYEGFHFINPLLVMTPYDTKNQILDVKQATITSQDALTTTIDVTVSYRLNAKMTPHILQNTGNFKAVVETHLIPKFRSLLRQHAKSVERAEDFFKQETQIELQENIASDLRVYMDPVGIIIAEIQIRNMTLPDTITRAIEKKKEREQEVEKQSAELERIVIFQKELIAAAEATRDAAVLIAEKIKTLSDAEAYEIKTINDAIDKNPAYLRLQALETLGNISKNSARKTYFINGDSPSPLPLMHMGDDSDK